MENNNQVKNNGKGKNIVIVFLILIVLGLSGFIVYDKYVKEEVNTNETKTESKETIKDITNSSIAQELEKTLITKDNYLSLYLSKNISINDVNDIDLIKFNLKKYKEDKNLDYIKNVNYKNMGNLLLTISKNDLNTYMNEKYYVNNTYNLSNIDESSLTNSSDFDVCVSMIVEDDNYKLISIGASCAGQFVKNKLIKAEEDNDYVYLYDTAVTCTSEANSNYCNKTSDDRLYNTAVYKCDGEDTSCAITDRGEGSDQKFAEYVINNLSDSLNKYKHTFKKVNNNYYWVSTEIVK